MNSFYALNVLSLIVFLFFHPFSGLMPYNFICVQTGCLLSTLKSMDDVFTWSTLLTLMGIAFVALIPGLLSRKLSKSKSRETLNSTISS
uniref:Uncharacterized protein n=1 Tax=Tetranychus urticae TaxID=32264 RepID=T1KMR1_TETUR